MRKRPAVVCIKEIYITRRSRDVCIKSDVGSAPATVLARSYVNASNTTFLVYSQYSYLLRSVP